MIRRIIVLLFVFVLAAIAQTKPALHQPIVIEGYRVYPDAEESNTFYYPPFEIALQKNGTTPLFTFQRFRYIGSSQLGDSGAFWTRGILSFSVEFTAPAGRLADIRQGLQRKGIKKPRLLPLSVSNIESRLIYYLPSQETGSIEGGNWQENTGNTGQSWIKRSFSVELDSYSTDLLWQAYKNNSVVLSLGVNVIADGVDFQKRNNHPDPRPVQLTIFADALPVSVDFNRHEGQFTSTDIDAKMPAGYTYLEVTCHDFNEEYSTDSARVIVEVRGTAINGDQPVERVEFSIEESGETRKQIHFQFAMNLDAGYSYKVTRINTFGELKAGEWTRVNKWSGSLDVSSGEHQPSQNAQQLDVRQLY